MLTVWRYLVVVPKFTGRIIIHPYLALGTDFQLVIRLVRDVVALIEEQSVSPWATYLRWLVCAEKLQLATCLKRVGEICLAPASVNEVVVFLHDGKEVTHRTSAKMWKTLANYRGQSWRCIKLALLNQDSEDAYSLAGGCTTSHDLDALA